MLMPLFYTFGLVNVQARTVRAFPAKRCFRCSPLHSSVNLFAHAGWSETAWVVWFLRENSC